VRLAATSAPLRSPRALALALAALALTLGPPPGASAAGSEAAGAAAAATGRAFPFAVRERTLPNGLRAVVVPFDSPGVVAYVTLVRTGSRDEVEPGHSGFAHFFEHMMFRGTDRVSQEEYNRILKRMGADSNAGTSDDWTRYHIIGPARELATMVEIEADRFQNLKYDEAAFRTEALAILGEYNKNISSPFTSMHERLRELAFEKHTYGHTTLGYLEDIRRMPEEYEYSRSFFRRFYRPENTILIVAGDVRPEQVFGLVERHYGGWQPGYQAPAVAAEPPPREAKRAVIAWAQPTRPYLMVGYRAPAFSTATVDLAAIDVASQLLFAPTAPLYQELVVEQQLVDLLAGGLADHRDPYLFTITARATDEAAVGAVEAAIARHVERLLAGPIDLAGLDRIKQHLRNAYALSLDSPGAVAFSLAHFLSLTGRVDTVEEVYRRYQEVTAADVQRVVRELFVPRNSTTVVVRHDAAAAAAGGAR
jgi:zinc protease